MGTCPTEGNCDDPTVRDGFLSDDATPVRWSVIGIVDPVE